MGTAYQFECPACGYSAHVCGGRDSGTEVALLTSVYGDCRVLVDVPVGRPWDKGLPATGSDDPEMGRCPECKGVNHIPWVKTLPMC
jgi:hypothetical protein